MAKQKLAEVCLTELRDDLISLKIINFHKYVGNLANEIAKCSQIGANKRQGGIKRGVGQDSNLRCQTVTFLLNQFWACRFPVQAKRPEHQPFLQSGLQAFTSLMIVSAPMLFPEKS